RAVRGVVLRGVPGCTSQPDESRARVSQRRPHRAQPSGPGCSLLQRGGVRRHQWRVGSNPPPGRRLPETRRSSCGRRDARRPFDMVQPRKGRVMHNTSEMVDLGTHIRTSPFARAIYDTAATEVTINAWNDVYATQASAAEIGVYVDGVYQESVRPTANGASTHVVALPAGDKRVEVVIGGFRGPAVAAVPTVIGPG